jgi:hypothetical protein
VDAEGIAPSAGALGKGHAALAAPMEIGRVGRSHARPFLFEIIVPVPDSFGTDYGLNGVVPLVFGAPNSVPLFGVSVSACD